LPQTTTILAWKSSSLMWDVKGFLGPKKWDQLW